LINQEVVDEYRSVDEPVEDKKNIDESKTKGIESVATPGFPPSSLIFHLCIMRDI
jgi:hypothetical protein